MIINCFNIFHEMAQKIYNLDLIYNGSPVPFAISAMEKMTDEYGGIAEDPHRHNYYWVIWSITATRRRIIGFLILSLLLKRFNSCEVILLTNNIRQLIVNI